MSNTVLVTGGFGLVGSATVRRLAELGRNVVVTDLDTPANRKAQAKLPSGVVVRWADLTDNEQVQRLVSDVAPDAVVHLAAVIAPAIYPIPKVARRVNVDGTANLVRVVEGLPTRPRFVHASSITVMGPRNPHRTTPPLRAEEPMRPYDVYSGQKSEAEEIVRGSDLEWVVLRLGAVLSPDMGSLPVTTDAMYFQAALPSDGRVQTVDVRDVAWAFAAATTADVAREILLIGGDDSHRLTYAEVTSGLVAALGLPGAMPPGRPGDPDSDDDWFVTDWMDTTRAQEALQFQNHSWHDLRAELAQKYRLLHYPGRLIAPMVRLFMTQLSPYRNAPGRYAAPWGAIRARLGEPAWDRPGDRVDGLVFSPEHRERTFMRVPRAVANFNRRVTNPVARSLTPWLPYLGTLEHTGRRSGRRYRTPLLVFRTRDGFAILIGYGPETDWVKNVHAGGPTVLHKLGRAVAVGNPQIVGKAEAAPLVTPGARWFYRLFPYNEATLLLTKTAGAQGN